jgi:hypothetical protein
VGRPSLDNPGVPLRPRSKRATGTSDYHPENSDVSEHGINMSLGIQFQDTGNLSKKSGSIRGAIDTELYLDSMNREGDLSLGE